MKLQTAMILTAASGTAMSALILYHLFQPAPGPNIGWPVELIPEPEASAYYDGRKLVNDNQRNWVDMLAEQAQVAK